jgi:hypothetical protein
VPLAHRLDFTVGGGNAYATSPTLGYLLNLNTIRCESDSVYLPMNSPSGYIWGQAASNSSDREFGIFFYSGSPSIRIIIGGQTTTNALTEAEVIAEYGSNVITGTFSFEVNMSTGGYAFYHNGVSFKTGTASLGNNFNSGTNFNIGARSGSNTSGDTSGGFIAPALWKIGNTRIYLDGVLTRNFVSDGVGSTWEEIENNQNALLQSFPTDGTQWESYNTPSPVSITGAFSLPLVTIAGTVTSSVPSPVISSFFSFPVLTVLGNQSASLPQPVMSSFFSLPIVTVLGNQSSGLPQPVITASFTLPSFVTSGNVSVTLPSPELTGAFSFSVLSIGGAVNAGLPTPQLSGSFAFPLITVTSNQSSVVPAPVLSASFTLPVLTITGNQSAGIPRPVLSGNVTLPLFSYTGSVNAVVPLPIITSSFSLPILTVLGSTVSTQSSNINVWVPVNVWGSSSSLTITGSFSLPVLTTTGLIDATLPTPVSISGAFSLPNLTTQAFITVSGVVIVINSNTNINQLYLDNNIDQEYLSNNITYP